jgi:hypothetical protein
MVGIVADPEAARIQLVLPPDLDTRFRIALIKARRTHKGAISEAICEAIEMWLSKQR